MPFTREVRRVAVLLEKLGDGRRLLAEKVLVARGYHDRQRGADGDAPGDERRAARRATGLTVPGGEQRAFLGKPIDVRGRVTEVRAAVIDPEIVPAGVVLHQHEDVGLLLLRGRRVARDPGKKCDAKQRLDD